MSDFKKVSSSFLDAINKVVGDDRKKFFEEQKEHEKLVAEKMLSPKQKKIAKVAGDPNKIDAADFAALRSGKKMNSEGYNAKREHELNMDAAQRHMDRRAAEGEDMTGAKIHPKTYEIIMPKSNTKKMAKEEVELDEGVRSWLVGKVAKHGGMIPREVANVIVSNLHKSAPETLRKHPNYNRMTKELHQHISGAKDAEEAVRRSTDKNYLRSLEKKHISDITEEIEHLDELTVDLLKRARDKAERISGDSLGKNPIKMKAYQRQADTFTDALHKKYKAQLSSGKRKYVEENEHIDETLGATLRKYVPGLGKEELKKRYLDADTRTRYTLGKAPENHTDADKKELEMHAKKLRRYGKLVDKHIGEAYDEEVEQVQEGDPSYYKGKSTTGNALPPPGSFADRKRTGNTFLKGFKSNPQPIKPYVAPKSKNEEVEQIDELSPNTMHNFKAGRREKQRDFKLDPHMSAGEYDDRSKKVVQGLKLANRRLKAQGQSTKTPDYLRSMRSEATDTPGNGREHQCAIHVKNEQFGEGRTLTTNMPSQMNMAISLGMMLCSNMVSKESTLMN